MIICPSHPDLLYGCTGPFRLRSPHELTVLRVCVLSDILDVSVHAFVLCLTVCACAYMCVCLSANTSLTLPLSHLCVPPPPPTFGTTGWAQGMKPQMKQTQKCGTS